MKQESIANSACPACGKVGYVVRFARGESVSVRGEEIEINRVLRCCTACGQEFESTHDPDWKLDAFAVYRSRKGMLTPAQIKQWRKDLGLTQDEVTSILGWGDATIGRYENGSLQTDAHDRQLKGIMDPSRLLDLLETSRIRLPEEKYNSILEKIARPAALERLSKAIMRPLASSQKPLMTGNRELDLHKAINVVRCLLAFGEAKTKLNKLLFYADFVHYRDYGYSITGLPYARIDHGPVPEKYELLFANLIELGEIRVVERLYGDIIGEEMLPIEEAEESTFSDTELRVVMAVRERFKGWSATRIRNYSHKEKAWLETVNGKLIPYSYAKFLLF